MGMVQEQRLQLKIKFLLGYNMETVVLLGGDKNLVGGIFPGGERLAKACADDGVLVK